jgi:hypothetical protein
MSSSLSETVIDIVLSLMISANAELDELELELEPVDAEPKELDVEVELDPLPEPEVPPEETVSPTESLVSEAIVPLAGA